MSPTATNDPFQDPFGDRYAAGERVAPRDVTQDPFEGPNRGGAPNDSPTVIDRSRGSTDVPRKLVIRAEKSLPAKDPRLFVLASPKTPVADAEAQGLGPLELRGPLDRIELHPSLKDTDVGGWGGVAMFQAKVPAIHRSTEFEFSDHVFDRPGSVLRPRDPAMSPGVVRASHAAMVVRAQDQFKAAGPEGAESLDEILPPPANDAGATNPFKDDETSEPSDASALSESRDADDPGADSDEPDVDDRKPSTGENCSRVYNDRNCCDHEEECRKMLVRLNERSIRDISLDIAAPFEPTEKDPKEVERLREQKLGKLPPRTWMDQDGNVLAEGRFVGLRQNNVLIRDESGTETPIPQRSLSADDQCFVNSWWNLPNDCIAEDVPFKLRDFTLLTFTWSASALCHKPLYFEDVQLERYGHSAGPVLQPVLSGAHFFMSLALLPYNVGLTRPNECQYDLGYYRPGNCAPWLLSAFPWSKRAALSEVGAIAGMHGLLNL